MSFARKSFDSDVYVFRDFNDTYQCCICNLAEIVHAPTGPTWKDPAPMTKDEILAHLQLHIERGDKVPDYCIEGLKEDR